MALTSVELIDVLRQAAAGLENGGYLHQNNLSVEQIITELRETGIIAQGMEQIENLRSTGSAALTIMPDQLRHWADALEKQLLAMLDLPVDISFMRKAA